jgi:hypothetical protein
MTAIIFDGFHPIAWLCLFVIAFPVLWIAVVLGKKLVNKAKE